MSQYLTRENIDGDEGLIDLRSTIVFLKAFFTHHKNCIKIKRVFKASSREYIVFALFLF